jgi:TrmH family RNA methyltransferase
VGTPLTITSLQNPRVKAAVKLRQRSHRDKLQKMLIEGYRELSRALLNNHPVELLFYCPTLFQGSNNDALLETCRQRNVELLECAEHVFRKMSYRDRPDGFLAIADPIRTSLDDLTLPPNPLLVIAQAIEKPGNLGTILRSSDAAGVAAVIVCDPCTDVNNPNVVRASVGTLFSVPVAVASTDATLSWLQANSIACLAATPHTDALYFDLDMTGGTAIVVGTEQYGLSDRWMQAADHQVRIPMLGQADSLNVASATTLLLFEAVRQRQQASAAGA